MKKYTYPACKTVDVTEDWFGVQLPDPYAWLKEAKSKEVLDFVAAEMPIPMITLTGQRWIIKLPS